jgi:hypothetical protein
MDIHVEIKKMQDKITELTTLIETSKKEIATAKARVRRLTTVMNNAKDILGDNETPNTDTDGKS